MNRNYEFSKRIKTHKKMKKTMKNAKKNQKKRDLKNWINLENYYIIFLVFVQEENS